MIKKILLSFVGAILAFAIYLYLYLGAHKNVTITIENLGPFYMIHKDHLGAYHEIGSDISKVESWVESLNLACPQTFGEYIDDPNSMDQDRLRSRGGCLLRSPFAQVDQIPKDFKYEVRDQRRYVVGRFEGSPSIGPFKVYPKIIEYMEHQRIKGDGPVIEIYNIRGNDVLTEYLFPIAELNSP